MFSCLKNFFKATKKYIQKLGTLAAGGLEAMCASWGLMGRLCRDVGCHGTSPWIVFFGSQIESYWSTLATHQLHSSVRSGHKTQLAQTYTAMDMILDPVIVLFWIVT